MFDVVEFFCHFCQYNSHVDVEDANAKEIHCKNCGRVIHENLDSGFSDSEETELERLSDVIRKNDKRGIEQ